MDPTKVVCLALICAASVVGQAPVRPVTKAPGDTVTLEIWAKSLPKRAPVALHWDVVFPAQLVEITDHGRPGSAAEKSGKSLHCKARNSYAYACVLAGGEKPIADGLVAVFHFKVRPKAPAGTIALRVEQAVATTADSKAVSLANTQANIVIRP